MEFLEQHWSVITGNLSLFATWTIAWVAGTWAVIHFLYRHRIEEDAAEIQRLRSKVAELKEEAVSSASRASNSSVAPSMPPGPAGPATYDYPDAGDHGANILGQSSTDLVVEQSYSMAATVPSGGMLKVHLAGSAPVYLEQSASAWVYSVSTRNWQGTTYDQQDHTQVFTARGGDAELMFIPKRPGKITIAVYEGGRTPAWEKVLKVVERHVA